MAKSEQEKIMKELVSELENASFGREEVEFFSTGVPALDWLVSGKFDGGGLPLGRIIEFFGDPSTGKSLIMYNILARIQQAGGLAVLDDVERAYSMEWAQMCGIDPDRLIIEHSGTVSEHEVVIQKVVAKAKGVFPFVGIGLDSVAMLSTTHEMDTDMDKRDLTKASDIRKLMRRIKDTIGESNTLYMVANHVIANIGGYGRAKVATGGSGIPFLATVRISLSLRERLKDKNKEIFGVRSEFLTEKNRFAAPYKKVNLIVHFATGLLRDSGLFELGLRFGVVEEVSQGWYKLKGDDKKRRQSEFSGDEVLEILKTLP